MTVLFNWSGNKAVVCDGLFNWSGVLGCSREKDAQWFEFGWLWFMYKRDQRGGKRQLAMIQQATIYISPAGDGRKDEKILHL